MKKALTIAKGFFKAVVAFLKKFWWLVIALLTFIAGARLARKNERRQLKTELEEIKRRKAEELQRLEKELERLKAEEKVIYDKKHFSNVDEAIKYLNEVLKKLQE